MALPGRLKWIAGAGLLALVFRSRRSSVAFADRESWIRLEDETGLAVRMPSRSWTSPAVRDVLRAAGRVAAAHGGQLQIADAGPPVRGVKFSTHKSHRWGRDIDMGYTRDIYPTPLGADVDGLVVEALASIAPQIEVVYAAPSRVHALEGHGFEVNDEPGHEGHLHLRLRAELVSKDAT